MKKTFFKTDLPKTDVVLLIFLLIVLAFHYLGLFSYLVDSSMLAFFASVATLPVIFSAYRSLKNKKITVDLLASIALIVSMLNHYWASAVFINLMLTSARIFDSYVQTRGRNAIRSLLKLRPEKVKVKLGKKIIEKTPDEIRIGDLIVVELGDRIPVDGKVESGQAQIDQSSITGESLPVEKGAGDKVLSSTLNMSGSLLIRAEKVGQDTTFEKIIKLVEESQRGKIAIETIIDKFTTWYIVVTFAASLLIYLFTQDLNLVLSVLLVTCADDIAIAIPMAFSAGIASSARRGIIVKGGAFLEGLSNAKTVIVDKTGTLTKMKLKVKKIIPLNNQSEKEVVALTASADFFSGHPIARTIIEYVESKKIRFIKPNKFKEFPGKGSQAFLKSKTITCGKLNFLKEKKVSLSEETEKIIQKAIKNFYGNVLYVALNRELVGIILLEDEVRPEAKETVEKLKSLGVKEIVMLTGDSEKVAQRVSEEVGTTSFHANLFPEEKVKYVKKYLNKKSKVVMVGDGVNDAAALAASDIGIAMGAAGADTAVEASDIALMKNDFSKVAEAFELSNKVNRISRQDFWIWGILNSAGLFLVFSKIIGPEGAALFNFVTDFIPLLNSVRMFTYRGSKNR